MTVCLIQLCLLLSRIVLVVLLRCFVFFGVRLRHVRNKVLCLAVVLFIHAFVHCDDGGEDALQEDGVVMCNGSIPSGAVSSVQCIKAVSLLAL